MAASTGAGQVAEVPANMEAEAELMEALLSIPVITKALPRPSASCEGGVDINVMAAQHNLPANNKRQLQYSVVVPDAQNPQQVLVPRLPTELQPSALNSLSPSGGSALIAKTHSDGVLLEFWSAGRLVKELLAPKALHGPIINDGWFSRGAAWSPDEAVVVYVAESRAAEQTPLFGSTSTSNGAGRGVDGAGGSGSGNGGGNGGGKAAAAAPRTWRGVAAAVEDWGELNTGKRPPTLFALNTSSWQVHQLQGLTGLDASWGQPAWTPDGQGLVAVAWPHKALNLPGSARRLGIVHCYNRPCELYYVPYAPPPPAAAAAATAAGGGGGGSQQDPQQQQQQQQQQKPKQEQEQQAEGSSATAAAAEAAVPVRLSGELQSALSPVFSPDGSQLLFLSLQAAVSSGVHAATASLHKLPWSTQPASQQQQQQQPQCVVPIIASPTSRGGFPGLYAFSLPEQGFADPQTLLLTSQWYSQTVILQVDLDGGVAQPVTPTDAAQGSWTLQGICNGLAVAILSSPTHPPRLMLARIPSRSDSGSSDAPGGWAWSAVAALQPDLSGLPLAAAALDGLRCEVLDVTPTVGDTSLPMQAVVQVSKAAAGPAPTIVVPHGGPHTALAVNFYVPFALLAARGYCMVAVNYRGSLGFGEDGVQSLPGHIGSHDVEDCVAALDAAVAAGLADPSRASVCGGSHGGFLTGHLMGQHPGRFRCAALRNPVLNLTLMVGVTDIPDWCYVEAYGSEEGRRRFSAEPSPEDLALFWSKSPAAHISKVSSPMLFLLGAKDRRVPLDDGWRYVDALNSRGIPNRVLVFPEDSHALDKPQTEFEQWLNIAWWLKQHM